MSNYINSKFSFISHILPDVPKTWEDKIFISFDLDWCHDDIILDTLDLISKSKKKSTWFITHNTSVLNKLENDPTIQLGIHPNFNNLLSNSGKQKNHEKILSDLLDILPSTRAVRSHSLLQSEKLLDSFYKFKISHISNFYIPYSANIEVKPYRLWNNLIITPHRWQDNVELKMNNKLDVFNFLDKGLNIFNFHPIHIFLNSEKLQRYENSRHIHHDPKELIKIRFNGYGVRTFFKKLIGIEK